MAKIKTLILAGGLGTRLGDLTKTLPKCLMDINGLPVIERVIQQLALHKFYNLTVNISYLHNKVMDYLGDRVLYFYEPTLLNTAGTVLEVSKMLDSDLLVVNADTLSNADYGDLIEKHLLEGSPVTVLSRNNRCGGAYVIKKEFAREYFKKGKTIDECLNMYSFYYNQEGFNYYDIGTPEKLEIARKVYGE